MTHHPTALSVLAAAAALALAPTASAITTLYDNGAVTNSMAMASRPGLGGKIEIEAADDFILNATSQVTSGSFTGLVTAGGTIGVTGIEIYRVFPLDSTNPPPAGVPTRVNSPSDVAFDSRDSLSSLTFSTTLLAPTFTANNSVLNGIHPSPNQTTGGEGPVTGAEMRFDFSLTNPLTLAAGHYFFVPQVQVTSGEFYWLSASRPISGVGTTPIIPDLQTWIRNENLAPNWLRVGTDIVGGATPPTFNAAFTLKGNEVTTAVPDRTPTLLLLAIGLALLTGLAATPRWHRLPS